MRINELSMEHGNMKPLTASGRAVPGAVNFLKNLLLLAKKKDFNLDYETIDGIMQRVCLKHNITGDQLHNDFKNQVGEIPDTWIKSQTVDESVSSKYLGPTDKVKINKQGWQIPLNKKGFGSS